jgi:CubicO group peptidase (beta-lactamase class C family)
VDERELTAKATEVLSHWPVAGLAAGVVLDGSLAWFVGHGLADVESRTSIDQDTVFRIASVTKTMTAIAVMQLWEQGLIDLDAPASDYLRSYRLIAAKPSFRPVTVRHLLTHTAGVRAVRTPADLFRPALGWTARPGCPAQPLAEYYGEGLRIDVEPGTKWAYSNHGFATLGQIVEDVSGLQLDRYLRDRVLDPLGMDSTELILSDRIRSRLATGYVVTTHGLKPVANREIATPGASSVYSTISDLARYAAALLGGGTNSSGTVLRPQTLGLMFQQHYQPDPRVPGMGLAFFRGEADGYKTVGHDGIWKGFHAAMVLAPEPGVGVLALVNTGWFSPVSAAGPAAGAILRGVLGLGPDTVRAAVPDQPWTWNDLCGWYSLGPGVLTDPQPRMLGAGVEVVVSDQHLTIRGQIPVPAVRRGLRLYPDADDPDAFRVELPGYGSGTSSVVFSRRPDGAVTALHLGAQPLTFHKRPDVANPRPWLEGTLAAGAVALAARRWSRRR